MIWYWQPFRAPGLRVDMPDMPIQQRHFRWRGIYGLSIGGWFIGVVNGRADRTDPIEKGTKDG